MDKAIHFLAGTVIFQLSVLHSAALGMLLVIVAAVGKEWYDFLHKEKHNADPLDALSTVAGGCFSCGIWGMYGLLH